MMLKYIQNCFFGMIILILPLNAADEQAVTPNEVISALENTFGVHPGERRNHIKGVCALGEFIGSPEAAFLTRSVLFSGEILPVVARFSLAGGNPNVSDSARIPKGFAFEIRLPNGTLQHMTMLSTPVFGAEIPKTFLDDIIAKKPDAVSGKPDPEKIKAFKETHLKSLPQAEFLALNNPSPSWADSSYFGIHTFKFINQKNEVTLVKWRFVPHEGEKQMTDDELKSQPQDFLEQELMARLEKAPLQWDMMLTIGQPGDSENDPTIAWPKDRKTIKVGTLIITSASSQKGAECENINFDPLIMSDGIELTDDPILLFRSPSYAISFGKRMSEQ